MTRSASATPTATSTHGKLDAAEADGDAPLAVSPGSMTTMAEALEATASEAIVAARVETSVSLRSMGVPPPVVWVPVLGFMSIQTRRRPGGLQNVRALTHVVSHPSHFPP